MTAARQLRESGWIGATDEVVLLNTGSRLVYPDTVPVTGVPVLPADGDLELPALGRPTA